MPILSVIRSKSLWLGIAATAAVTVAMCALGARLIVSGLLPRTAEIGWICGSYLLAGAAGTWIAARTEKGTVLPAMLLCGIVTVLAWAASLAVSSDMHLADGGWRIPVSTAAGCLFSSFLRANKRQGKRRKARRRPLQNKKSARRR